MPYANLGDVRIYYEIYGNELELTDNGICEKPTVVVLHGGPGIDHTFEVEFSRECSPFAQMILIDLILLDTEGYVDLERIYAAFKKRSGKEVGEIARKFFQKKQAAPEAITQYFEKCLPLCSKNPIPAVYFKRAILKPEVGAHMQTERATFNYMKEQGVYEIKKFLKKYHFGVA